MQQEANGFYRAVDLAAIIALEHDAYGIYRDTIMDTYEKLETVNKTCSGAPQQCANGAYRFVELLALIAIQL